MNGSSIVDEFKNAFNRPDNGHIQLILINLIVFIAIIISRVFIFHLIGPEAYATVLTYLAMPSNVDNFIFKPWTLITYMFVHEGFFHIFFNMLFLYWFGGEVIKKFLGSDKVVGLYILGGIAGGLLYITLYNLLPLYQDRVANSILFGASAGVFAVVVGAATFRPNHIFVLLFIGPVRIKYIAIFYVILSFANTVGSNAGGEIAHLGGAALGFLFIRQLQKGNDLGRFVIRSLKFFKSFFVRQPKIKVSYNKKASNTSHKSQPKKTVKVEQDEIDHILDKISQSGYDSLSSEEKQKLFNASKK